MEGIFHMADGGFDMIGCEMTFDVFLKGDLVDLVVLNEQIVEKTNWYNWFNDEENMRHMEKHYFPNTKEDQIKFFRAEISSNRNKLQLGICHKKDQILIGMISLSSIDHFHRKCEISGFIGEKKYQNLQNFLEANRLLIRHAFEQLNMNRIYGGTLINEIAELYVRALGFSREGTLKDDIYKNGKYNDAYLIAISQEQYKRFYLEKVTTK